MDNTILECRHIFKNFYDPAELEILKDISLVVKKYEFISIVGRSGCGKSTLLYILSTMDTAYRGELWIDHTCMTGQTEAALSRIRNEKIGFVFQFHYLINEFSALQKVMLPALKLTQYSRADVKSKAMDKLRLVKVDHLAKKSKSAFKW